jgi:hypothetical protein
MRTVTPRSVRIIQNFLPNDPWYHLLVPEPPVEVLLAGHSPGGGARVGVVEGGERLVSSDGQLDRSA